MGRARHQERVGHKERYNVPKGEGFRSFNAACTLYLMRCGLHSGGFNYGQQRKRNK